MKILVYMPQGRNYPQSQHSMLALDTSGHEVSLWFDREDNHPDSADHQYRVGSFAFEDWYDQHVIKLNKARYWAMIHDYDALMTIEDDIIVPPDALQKLVAVDAHIIYGLAVWKNHPHHWSATLSAVWGKQVDTIDQRPERVKRSWGQVIDINGLGFFCTLIRRPVLEAMNFHRTGSAAADWALAHDAHELGFRQRAHCGVLCKHIDGKMAYFPYPAAPYWASEEIA